MSELVFPLAGALVVFLIAVPLATLVAKGILVAGRRAPGGLPIHCTAGTYALVTAPTLVPALWFLSAALHQSEPGQALAACVVDRLHDDSCRDALLFAGVLALILGHGVVRRLHRDLAPRPAVQRLAATSPHGRRLAALCAAHPALARAAHSVAVVSGARDPVCTRKALRPVIEVEASFMDQLDDDALAAALLHEVEHARALDPLRYLLAAVSLSLNPLARLLRPELARWRLAREASCDQGAVLAGANPLALALAIVSAARPAPMPAGTGLVATLGGGCHGVKARVRLLLCYADQSPEPRRPPVRVLPGTRFLLALLLLLALPHATGTALLDVLHQGIEVAVLGSGLD